MDEERTSPDRTVLFLYARVHRLVFVILALASIPITEIAVGNRQILLPGSRGSLTFRTLAPALVASLLVANRHTEMKDWEAASAHALRSLHDYAFYLGIGLAAVTTFLSQALINDISTAAVIGRSFLMSTALALVSGSLTSWKTAWILPLASYFPLTYLQLDGNGLSRWWNWPGRPPWDASSWLLAIASFVVGVVLVWAVETRVAAWHRLKARK